MDCMYNICINSGLVYKPERRQRSLSTDRAAVSMGLGQSREQREEERLKAKGLVLVPPLFERDFRGRSRMTGSSYDWMFCKPGLKWLFNDYIRQNEGYSIVRLRYKQQAMLCPAA